MDYDIPVAHAQPLPPHMCPPVAPATATAGFSAAAVSAGMPTAQPLGDDQIKQLQEQGFTVGLAKVRTGTDVSYSIEYMYVWTNRFIYFTMFPPLCCCARCALVSADGGALPA